MVYVDPDHDPLVVARWLRQGAMNDPGLFMTPGRFLEEGRLLGP